MENEIKEKAKRIESIIDRFLPKEEGFQKTVIQAMNYTMKAGGKRIRPMLMEETYHFFGGEGEMIYPFMAAIEMIHTYSLVHDDLPAMDNDDYRRGRKTAHVVFGEDMAILAGDGLLNYAYEVAVGALDDGKDMVNKAKALKILASKPGLYGMLGGQAVDVEYTGKKVTNEQLEFIYENKTGALIEASMMIGAVLAGADQEEVEKTEKIAGKIGLAFQIQDDILDMVGDEEAIGKPVGSDAKNEKQTYASIYGIEKAKQKVKELSNQAIEEFVSMPYENPFLMKLISYLIDRQV